MSHQSKYPRWHLVLLLAAALACNFPTLGGGSSTDESTTLAATNTPLPIATATPEADVEPTTEATTEPSAEETVEGNNCTFRAGFVEDVSIPDDTTMSPNSTFDKTWRIRNSGTCPWEAGTTFTYLSGDNLSDETTLSVPPTEPDQEIELTVPMKAPTEPGTYRSNWQLQTPDGQRYGGVFYVQIVVASTEDEELSPAPTNEAANAPTDLFGAVSEDCDSVALTWQDAGGESAYRLSGPGLNVNLSADTTSYTWNNPPDGLSVITLTALDSDEEEIGSVETTVGVTCGTGQPDLVAISVTFVPTTPVAHLPDTATVKIKNQGDADSGAFTVAWRSLKTTSTPACQWIVSEGLEADETQDLTCTVIPYSAPYANLVTTVEVDTSEIVFESDEDNNVLETDITVVSPETVFDFVDNAEIATWIGGPPTVDIPWPGSPDSDQGYARLTGGTLETGGTIQGLCLETHPRWVAEGIIRGEYEGFGSPDYLIEPGDHFVAAVSMLQDATQGDVTYRVMLILSESGGQWIISERHTYGEGIEILRADLSAYAGQTASLILQVEAGDDSTDDQACWIRAEIYRYP